MHLLLGVFFLLVNMSFIQALMLSSLRRNQRFALTLTATSQRRKQTKVNRIAPVPLTSMESFEKGGKTLVIVESPAKARTIQKILNEISSDFIVDFSAGHVRELVSKKTQLPASYESYTVCDALGLQSSSLGIDVLNGFKPLYTVLSGKASVIRRLKEQAKGVDRIVFATDEDREGEAISWHLLDILKPKVPYKRAVFHEITKTAVLNAFRHPRDIDMNLVYAQEARSILDKLTGFTLSPLLWRYIAFGLSAGRVQSCGLHLIMEREKLRWKFVPSNYYSLSVYLSSPNHTILEHRPIIAKLIQWNGKRIANEKDFDGNSGKTKSSEVMVLDEEKSEQLLQWLSNTNQTSRSPIFEIIDRSDKTVTKHPAPPFITSSLQQEASRKLRFSPARTMKLAQSLYEAGRITYMRTDSPTLSTIACEAIQSLINQRFGRDYLSSGSSEKKGRTAPKNAQEAHEAIRPALIDGTMKSARELGLAGDEARLYDLIYRRTIASQMKESKTATVSFTVKAFDPHYERESAIFRFAESKILFDGYLAIWGRSEQTAQEKKILEDIFRLSIGERLEICKTNSNLLRFATAGGGIVQDVDLDDPTKEENSDKEEGAEELEGKEGEDTMRNVPAKRDWHYPGFLTTAHTTRAPTRFTEASFIEELESVGVGRPSTYSMTLQVLKDREYILVDKRTIIPTLKGLMVSNFLEVHFNALINERFTAEMEQSLDLIAQGIKDKTSFIQSYYLGPSTATTASTSTSTSATKTTAATAVSTIDQSFANIFQQGLLRLIEEKIASAQFHRQDSLVLPYLKDYGVFAYLGKTIFFLPKTSTLQNAHEQRYIPLPADMKDLRSITVERIESLMQQYQQSMAGTEELSRMITLGNNMTLGLAPHSKKEILVKLGPFGYYLQMGKKKASLPRWVLPPSPLDQIQDKEDHRLTLERAISFFQLPLPIRTDHPELPEGMLLTSYYGDLYLRSGGGGGSGAEGGVVIPAGYWIEDIVNDRDEILSKQLLPQLLIAQQKNQVGYWSEIPSDLMSLVVGKEGVKELPSSPRMMITYLKGPFGPYLRCGKLNCALNAKQFPTIDEMTLDIAVDLLTKKGERELKKLATQRVQLELSAERDDHKSKKKENEKEKRKSKSYPSLQTEKVKKQTIKDDPKPTKNVAIPNSLKEKKKKIRVKKTVEQEK